MTESSHLSLSLSRVTRESSRKRERRTWRALVNEFKFERNVPKRATTNEPTSPRNSHVSRSVSRRVGPGETSTTLSYTPRAHLSGVLSRRALRVVPRRRRCSLARLRIGDQTWLVRVFPGPCVKCTTARASRLAREAATFFSCYEIKKSRRATTKAELKEKKRLKSR